jgi:type IV pilus assembly protein PilB
MSGMIAARKRLGELLLEDGMVDHLQLETALGHQRKWGGKLGETLVHLRLVPEPAVVSALSRRFDCQVARLADLRRGPQLEAALALVPAELARRHLVLPLEATAKTLTLAMADPANVLAADEISARTGRRVVPRIAGAGEIGGAIDRFYGAEFDDLPAIELEAVLDGGGATPFDAPPGRPDWFQDTARPAAVVRPLRAVAPAAPATAHLADALQRMVAGAEVPALPPAALVAAVTKVLVRRGLVTEAELVRELMHDAPARTQRPRAGDGAGGLDREL